MKVSNALHTHSVASPWTAIETCMSESSDPCKLLNEQLALERSTDIADWETHGLGKNVDPMCRNVAVLDQFFN